MADIYFFHEEDNEDNDGVHDESDSGGSIDPDDLLPPVQKLERYAGSDNIFNRQIVARTVLETLRVVTGQQDEVNSVLAIMNKLSDDYEPSVRSELMEQVPHIAMFCQEFKNQLEAVVPQHLLPMVVKFLTDNNNQVRKTSQAALLVLLEQGLVERSDVQEQVCPVILRLTEADSIDDYRTEAVALLSKMAPLIGKEMTETVFLDRFANLCVDALFHVRKVCAANFGDFANVVGCEATERVLLPKFFYLCEDGVWGVRKACADVFMPVSCVCSHHVRRTELAPLFINLLRDQSRWVRMAAFQALGPFISTFADPAITALLHNDNGEIIIADPDLLSQRLDELETIRAQKRQEENVINSSSEQQQQQPTTATDKQSSVVIDMDLEEDDAPSNDTIIAKLLLAKQSEKSPEEDRAETYAKSSNDSEDSFNTFQYWREPVPSLDLDTDVIKAETSPGKPEVRESGDDSYDSDDDYIEMEIDIDPMLGVKNYGGMGEDDETSAELKLHLLEDHLKAVLDKETTELDRLSQELSEAGLGSNTEMSKSSDDKSMELFRFGSSSSAATTSPSRQASSESSASTATSFRPPSSRMPMRAEDLQPPDPALPKGPPEVEQDIVPQLLIDHYVSMIDPSRVQTVDSEIARHCAFALPAVALTLGRSNWPLVKDTYEALACDMQWKVRRTLASSIHELGIILGDEAAAQDLIPIFNGFFKDLDEVRIGILKHLADFLKMLKPEARREYLPKLSEFLKMDNDRNWRFRQELADQLGLLVPLFSPQDVQEYIAPIGLVLIRDKVSAVRQSAIDVHLEMVRTLLTAEDGATLSRNLLSSLVTHLAGGDRWVHRQTFAFFCQKLFSDSRLAPQQGEEPTTMLISSVALDLLTPLLDLAWDNVPNVRLAVARAISQIKSTSYFEKEAAPQIRDRVDEATAYLACDRDPDVRSVFRPMTSSPEKFYDSDGEAIGDMSSLPV